MNILNKPLSFANKHLAANISWSISKCPTFITSEDTLIVMHKTGEAFWMIILQKSKE